MSEENFSALMVTADESLLSALKYRFVESGVTLMCASSRKAFKNILSSEKVSAVIMDSAHVKGILGLDAEEAVAKYAPLLAPRIMMVIAEQYSLPGQVVRLLKLGAHDVVSKPLKPRILAEQVKALVRVFSPDRKWEKRIFSSQADTLEMDYPCRKCRIKTFSGVYGSPLEVKLTRVEFQVLYSLLRKKGALVTYEDFRSRLWPTASSPREILHTLHQLVANIRKKISPCAVKIENLRGEGFRLEDVVKAGEPASTWLED